MSGFSALDLPDVPERRMLRVALWVWRRHLYIPQVFFWLGWLVGLPLAVIGAAEDQRPLFWGGLILAALGLGGVLRWWLERTRSRGALVVALFAAPDLRRSKQVQGMILTGLSDQLSEAELQDVHHVDAVVAPSDRVFARRLWRRLRARYLVYGEARENPQGGLSIYTRVLQPGDRQVFHLDPHTREVLPEKTTWRYQLHRLTAVPEALEGEYPADLIGELEAVVRGSAGLLIADRAGDPARAERLLREALAAKPDSRSHQLDRLRTALASTVAVQDRDTEAIEMLRRRAGENDASPDLLRKLAAAIHTQDLNREYTPEELEECISLLRRAANDHGDPQRDMTLHNLVSLLWPTNDPEVRREASGIVDELLESESHYRDAWYVKRMKGAILYGEAVVAYQADDTESARRSAKEAARWYARAIRARPRFRIHWPEGPRRFWFARFPASPIMYANAVDAHQLAGQPLRARWRERRFERLRATLWKRGMRHFQSGRFDMASAAFDWMIVGRHAPEEGRIELLEMSALVVKAVLSQQMGHFEQADEEWQAVRDPAPALALTNRASIADDESLPLPEGLPGDDTTNLDEIRPRLVDELNRLFPGPGS